MVSMPRSTILPDTVSQFRLFQLSLRNRAEIQKGSMNEHDFAHTVGRIGLLRPADQKWTDPHTGSAVSPLVPRADYRVISGGEATKNE